MASLLVQAERSRASRDCPAEILRCPITRGPLRPLTAVEIDGLNQRIERGELQHSDGTSVSLALDEGFICLDGSHAYAVQESIALMLPALAIVLDPAGGDSSEAQLRAEKRAVQHFYDEIGWTQNERGDAFVDAENWEDLRPVVKEYLQRCHARVARHLAPRGKHLLDVASGPVQYDEYLQYSQGYGARICVDISFAALKRARQKLGNHGIYILGDITNLPLADGAVDGAVSLHTIYHIPADEQANAFREIHRVLAPGCTAAIVYCWRSRLIRWAMLPAKIAAAPFKLARKLVSAAGRSTEARSSGTRRKLYYHAHPHAWFVRELGDLPAEVHVWRSVNVPMLKAYVHPWLFGRAILKFVYRIEELCPQLLGRLGAYPLIVLRKEEASSARDYFFRAKKTLR
jgi:SAM-dependent methyltransferase/uncharacterized protein YbaR (Trm112 family)